jgi:hypothetical protein
VGGTGVRRIIIYTNDAHKIKEKRKRKDEWQRCTRGKTTPPMRCPLHLKCVNKPENAGPLWLTSVDLLIPSSASAAIACRHQGASTSKPLSMAFHVS